MSSVNGNAERRIDIELEPSSHEALVPLRNTYFIHSDTSPSIDSLVNATAVIHRSGFNFMPRSLA